MKNVKEWGQYFTPKIVTDFMVGLIENRKKPSIFEPCAGEGVFLVSLSEKGLTEITAYELDKTLKNNSNIKIKYRDTLLTPPKKKFDVVIGNPPYIRWKNIPIEVQDKLKNSKYWKNKINGLNDLLYLFILLSIESLEEGGELIFITPTFWTSTLHSKLIREKMMSEGEITHLINFDEMKIFGNVSSNLLIFRFVKEKLGKNMKVINIKNKGRLSQEILNKVQRLLGNLDKKSKINQEFYEAYNYKQFENVNDWNPLPPRIESKIKKIEKNSTCLLGEISEICNGMVSGLDEAFKINEPENFLKKERDFFIEVVKAKNLDKYFHNEFVNYIFLNNSNLSKEDLKKFPNIEKQLLKYKERLLKRYSYYRDIPFWEWVFLRNKKHIEEKDKMIVCPCKERFDSKQYLRFALIEGDYYITQDATGIIPYPNIKEDIKYFLAILNSEIIFEWLKYKGLNRGGVLEFSEKPLSIIPIKRIDWNNKREKEIYNEIINIVDLILLEKEWTLHHKQLNKLINEIYGF